ncbi:MAG: hypothetical protein LQ340_001541 [Diploschistes diacapsis]|nr:MAG: hypothetical protein LQ340_001541 [Diploschistes diacapsis]
MDIWLLWCYPIKHESTFQSLPTLPYEWPNGQGNIEKFLHGRENSPQWAAKYGSIYRIWSGTTSEVVLTKPEHIKAVFFDSDKHSKAVDNNSGFFMHQLLGDCVGLISTHAWRRVRAVVEPPFHYSVSQNHVDLIESEIHQHLDGLSSSSASSLRRRGVIDPVADFKMLPFFIVTRIIYGDLPEPMKAELRRLAPIREKLFHHVVAGGLMRFRWARHLPTAANRDLAAFRAAWEAFNRAACLHAKRAAALSPSAPAPPIVGMWDALDSGGLSKPELLQTLDEALFANLDVTMGSISWNLVFLAAHPSVQGQLLDEIAASATATVQGEGEGEGEVKVGKARDPRKRYLLSSSTLLSACVLESARLRPLATFSVPQSAPTARVIEGYALPAGTNFVVDADALNVRNAFWGPEADARAYRPQRFLERQGAAGLRYQYWRFGFGPRQCLGKYVADVIVRGLLAGLVERFEVGFVKEEGRGEGQWRRDMEMWISHPVIELSCKPRGREAEVKE